MSTMRYATLAALGLALTGAQALADGAVLKSCDWSSAGSCPFDAVKGTDYLVRVRFGQDCDVNGGRIELVNPVGQVTMTLPLDDTDCDYSGYGMEFRAAYTGTFQLRYTPSEGYTPGPGAAGADVLTDCRADAKTRCVIALGGRPVAGEHSANGDADWYKVADLRRGRLYTFAVTTDVYAPLAVVDAKGRVVARGHANGNGTGILRFRPEANGTYFLDVVKSHHYTVAVK